MQHVYLPTGTPADAERRSSRCRRPAALPADVAKTTTVAGQDRQLHRARRNRHDEPRHLSERDPARSDGRSGADAAHAAEGLEPAADRACTASGCPGGWYIQGAAHGRQHPRRRAARRGLRALHQHAQSPDQQLQRGPRRRDDDDGQGALHRDVRRAALHDQRRRIGRRLHEPADRRRASRASSTAWTSARRSPTRWRSRWPASTRICSTHYFKATNSGRLHRGAEGRGQRLPRHEGVHRRRQPVAADRSGAGPGRHRGLSVGAVGTRPCRRRCATTRRTIRRARGRRSSTRRGTSTASNPATGAALRPFDNIGVQYGLEALNAGAITADAVPRSQREDWRLRPGCQLRRRRGRSATPAPSSARTRRA